ncbi:bestrophin-2 isoform X2 [Bactrocera dorsalis]|uniref:Bestrophin-2 isoform X2 n=1 Tax=Bactrocera dorsalis TaxID=27457 RepID=A0A8N4QKR4_BACDO|nr:bestrophin-2 isoform X2 [Bactrocera dorsalis]
MTVSYAGEVPNGSSFGCFWRILWKWRGSVYKLVWRELIAYLCLYYTINLVYRFVLNEQQQLIFTKVRIYFGQQGESIPMSFVLGFYVNKVVQRWWEQYRLLPWPDTLALFISAAIPNATGGATKNETGRLMRRNIMRYMVLAYVITLQRISLRVKRRFPTTQHLVDAGLMHESESKIFDALNAKSPMSKYWMPLVWATNIINRARKEGLITSDHIVQTILMELSDIRRRLGGLIGYDTVCVPLVYTQVVTLVLYTYFIAALVGRQMLPNMPDAKDPDLYFPFFTVLQFVFYVGWLKVAEVLINPFGEDDDDIELNWLIDRHIKAAYLIVDEMHEEHPELLRDQYWECVVPKELPYTVASEHYRREEPKGSAENYKIKKEDAMYANIVPGGGKRGLVDDVYADYESVDTPMVERRKNNNWLVRQLSRMGSIRSQSTAYSSSGMAFNRNRLNSVYSSPESGIPVNILQQQQQAQQQQQGQAAQIQSKPSFYGKFVNRKSQRAQKQLIKQNSKLNGLNVNVPKTRPRIPTPDASKELGEKDLNGHPTTTALAQAVLPANLKDMNFGVASPPVTTNITTLSFPFTMSTSATDSLPAGTLNIVPIGATQMPTITTTASGFDASDLITTIPVSLSIQRSPSMRSINDFSGNENVDVPHNLNGGNGGGGLVATTNNAILTIKPLNGGDNISRNNSFNANLNLNLQDSYILERNASVRSTGQPVGSSVTDGPTTAPRDTSVEGRTESMGASGASAPSTLAKRTPEPAKGTKEVYV